MNNLNLNEEESPTIKKGDTVRVLCSDLNPSLWGVDLPVCTNAFTETSKTSEFYGQEVIGVRSSPGSSESIPVANLQKVEI